MITRLAELPGWLDPLRDGLADSARIGRLATQRRPRQARRAAVLILFSDVGQGGRIVFCERAATLRSHPGQIAFPGGSADPGDADLVATALRETHEEIGVPPGEIVTFGEMPAAHVAVSGFDVTAVLGWWTRPRPLRVVDEAEVAAVHQVGVADLVDPTRRVRVQHPSGYIGPAFEIDDFTIWGLTAHFTDAVLELGGWARPWDESRIVPVPHRHLRDRQENDHDV